MNIKAAELNYIIYRYLMESTFQHTAFTFGHESRLNRSTIDPNTVPPCALITLVQKGLQYLELEANFNDNDTDVDEDFSFIQPFDLLTKDANELRQIIKEKRQNQQKEKETDVIEKEKDVKEKEKDAMLLPIKKRPIKVIIRDDEEEEGNVQTPGPTTMDIGTSSTAITCARIPISDVMILSGHTAEVYDCVWNPSGSFLASGSRDSTARIWTMANKTNRYGLQSGPANVSVLKHSQGRTKEKNKGVSAIAWNMDGTLLATGSFDGKAKIWSKSGELKNTFSRHGGALFCVSWNKKGDYLLTGSLDKTVIAWDVKADDWKQPFSFHSGPVLDVDWRNDHSFASSATDKMIYVCKIGENRPIRTFSGHEGEVKCVKWDPTGSLLASCSDDKTAKIWSMKQENHIHDLRSHTKGLYRIKWTPTGPGTNNPNKQLLLASTSHDATIKLWDVEYGRVVRDLNGHGDCVYALGFSPNGEYLASGSMDGLLNIWSIKDGKILKTYTSNGNIFEVCWNKEGDRIALCTSNNSVCVLDFKK